MLHCYIHEFKLQVPGMTSSDVHVMVVSATCAWGLKFDDTWGASAWLCVQCWCCAAHYQRCSATQSLLRRYKPSFSTTDQQQPHANRGDGLWYSYAAACTSACWCSFRYTCTAFCYYAAAARAAATAIAAAQPAAAAVATAMKCSTLNCC
jgi:hypothetical protein